MGLKIKYAFVTTEADEPDAIENFIAGYELNGGDWSGSGGSIDIDNYINSAAFTQAYVDEVINNGYDILIRNTATNLLQVNNVLETAIERGLLPVLPSASNEFRTTSTTMLNGMISGIFCGSGDREVGNATSYPCVFFDKSATETAKDIYGVYQCGTEYTISEIQRVSSSVMYVKLSGITDVTSIGIIEQGIPLYISEAITGTNISPLPTGVIYTSNIIFNNGYFQIAHSTSAGTIGSFQSVTAGKLKYGVTSQTEGTSKVLIIRDGYDVDSIGMGITLKGITGFENNPDGVFRVNEYLNNDGYGNKIKIMHGLGSGTYDGNGTTLFATQSYATPYIAGQFAYMKDESGLDWYDIIGNAIKTSSSEGVYDTFNGYGYLNVSVGRDSNIDRALETPAITEVGQQIGALLFEWDIIPYAEEYEIYFRGDLVETLKAHINKFLFSPGAYGFYPLVSRSKRNNIKIRAKKGDTYSEFSNELRYIYNYSKGILIEQYD